MNVELEFIQDLEIYDRVVRDGILRAKESIWIATANVKDLQVLMSRRFVSIVKVLAPLTSAGGEVRILHSGVPSRPFRESYERYRGAAGAGFAMRRCPRVHLKAVIIDGAALFLGSANLTGAGIGRRSRARHNFESGIWTRQFDLIDAAASQFNLIWEGDYCRACGLRDKSCFVPLENPEGESEWRNDDGQGDL